MSNCPDDNISANLIILFVVNLLKSDARWPRRKFNLIYLTHRKANNAMPYI